MAFELTAVLRLQDEFSEKIQKATKNVEKFKRTSEKMGKVAKFGATMVAAGAATISAASIKAADTAQESYRIIRAGTGATGEALEELIGIYENVGKNVPDNLNKVAQVTADLNTLTGATGETLEAMATNVLNASRLMGESAENVGGALGRALNNWNLDAERGAEIMDSIFLVSQDTGAGMEYLLDTVTKFGPTFRDFGIGFEEAVALVGQMDKAGLRTDQMLRQMRSSLSDLDDPQKAFKDLIDVIQTTEDRTEKLAAASEIFGSRYAVDFVDAIESGNMNISEMINLFDDSQGAISQTAEEAMTTRERFSQAMNQMSIALAPLGESIMEIGEFLLPYFTEGIEKLGGFIEQHLPTFKEWIEKGFNALSTALQWAKENMDILIPTISAMLVPVLFAMAAAGWAAVSPWLPFIALMLAIGAVVAGVAYLWKKHGEKIKETIKSVVDTGLKWFNSFKDGVTDIWNGIKSTIVSVVNAIIDGINALIRGMNSIKIDIPDWVPGLGGKSFGFNIPEIPKIGGSHYHGLENVPYDGYVARLHKGEMVLPREEAEAYREGKGQGPSIQIAKLADHIVVREESDIDELARRLAREIRTAWEAGA